MMAVPITSQHRQQAERDADILLESQEIRMDVPRHNRAIDVLTEIEEKVKKEKREKNP